jgi:hypothetical protein
MTPGTKRLLREALAITALMAVVAGVLAWFVLHRGGPHNDRPLGGPNANVSQDGWPQFEVSAAVDPRRPAILLAGSNDYAVQNRVYTSTNSGRTWDSRPGPPLPTDHPCGLGDPAVAIGPEGRQYYALLVDALCDGEHMHLYVSSRAGPRGRWRSRRVKTARASRYMLDDKPAIAVDAVQGSRWRGRVYLAWTRWYSEEIHALAVSHSADGGRTWSRPVRLSLGAGSPLGAALVVGPAGTVYLTYVKLATGAIVATRSTDGGSTFAPPRQIASFRDTYSQSCEGEDANIHAVPAQFLRCVSPLPQIGVGRDGVYVTFGDRESNGTQGIFLVWLTADLVAAPLQRVGPPDSSRSDQFWPALAVDRRTGDIWVCYYDTTGDSSRKSTWFTCTVSRDGRHWADPLRAAESPSNESTGEADQNQYGDYEAVVAADGVAHPFWTDSRHLLTEQEEVYTAAIPRSAFR